VKRPFCFLKDLSIINACLLVQALFVLPDPEFNETVFGFCGNGLGYCLSRASVVEKAVSEVFVFERINFNGAPQHGIAHTEEGYPV